MEYILDFDSSERDPVLYPNPNDFTVKLNTPMYNVTNMDLLSAKIPNSQLLINDGNKYIDVSNTVVTLTPATYKTGDDLASNLQIQLASTSVDTVTFNSATNKLSFANTSTTDFTFNFYGGEYGFATTSNVGTPANVLGFSHNNVASDNYIIESGPIDLSGPYSILVRITNGSNDFQKDLYVDSGNFNFDGSSSDSTVIPLPTHFLGRLNTAGTNPGDILNYNGYDDPMTHYFHKGPESIIEHLRIRIYWNNGNKLIPYDFGNNNFLMKFKMKCSLDKVYNIKDDTPPPEDPPPVKLENLEPKLRYDKQMFIYISIGVLLVGLLLLTMMRSRQQPLAEPL